MNYEWVNSDGEAISVRRFYAMLAWFLLPFVVAMFTGCQPIAKPAPEPQSPRSAWVITEVHSPPKAKTIACECVDCTCDPCQCQPKSPNAAPVVDEPVDPKQHPRYDKSRGVIIPEGFKKTEYEFREAEPHPNQTRQRRGWRLLPRNRQGASYLPVESGESNESSGVSAASC
jgi:hypothetical protein